MKFLTQLFCAVCFSMWLGLLSAIPISATSVHCPSFPLCMFEDSGRFLRLADPISLLAILSTVALAVGVFLLAQGVRGIRQAPLSENLNMMRYRGHMCLIAIVISTHLVFSGEVYGPQWFQAGLALSTAALFLWLVLFPGTTIQPAAVGVLLFTLLSALLQRSFGIFPCADLYCDQELIFAFDPSDEKIPFWIKPSLALGLAVGLLALVPWLYLSAWKNWRRCRGPWDLACPWAVFLWVGTFLWAWILGNKTSAPALATTSLSTADPLIPWFFPLHLAFGCLTALAFQLAASHQET